MVDAIFRTAIAKKNTIIHLLQLLWGLLLIILFVGANEVYFKGTSELLFYQLGLLAGKGAVIIFSIILVPGIVQRFGIKHKFIALIKIFRRHLGISMYLLVLTHASWIRIIPWLKVGGALNPAVFELFGIAASILLFFLFVTSNDWSVKKLGIWWYRLHRLIYIIMWLILFHVGLQRISLWTLLMSIVVTIMMLSFLVEYIRKRQISA